MMLSLSRRKPDQQPSPLGTVAFNKKGYLLLLSEIYTIEKTGVIKTTDKQHKK